MSLPSAALGLAVSLDRLGGLRQVLDMRKEKMARQFNVVPKPAPKSEPTLAQRAEALAREAQAIGDQMAAELAVTLALAQAADLAEAQTSYVRPGLREEARQIVLAFESRANSFKSLIARAK